MNQATSRRDSIPGQSRDQATARKLAWLLGFSLPLTGGLTPSALIPNYPDQVTIVRLVTLGALVWLVFHPLGTTLPRSSKVMLQGFVAVMAYAAVTLLWAPDLAYGLKKLVIIGLALLTAIALILVVRGDRAALRSFALGVLMSGALQVIVATWEVATGRHLSLAFGAEYVAQWNLVDIEQAVGSVAWGSLGNPNDLGGYLLLATAVFITRGAFGVQFRPLELVLGWGLLLLAIVVSLTALDDARAFRLGLAALLAMHLLDRLLPPMRNPFRVPLVLIAVWAAIAAAALWGGSFLMALRAGGSDAQRLELISEGFSVALGTGGFGRGLGTERALIDSGAIPLNFHNVVVQLAAELGLVVAGVFLVYLVSLIISWALVTRSAQRMGREASLARATLGVALLIYGVTSSGVLESPPYAALLAATVLLGVIPHDTGSGVPWDKPGIAHAPVDRRLA